MTEPLQKFERTDRTAKFPFLVLAVSILLTVGITYIFYQSAKNKDSIRFNNEVNRLQTTVENKINLYVALLKGGRGFIESNPVINRQTFAEYVESLDLRKNYAGVQGIGYAKVVTANERTALTEKINAEGGAGFHIFPAAEKDLYEVILYLEPLNERSRRIIGYDLSSEASRRATLEQARDSGEVMSSPKIFSIKGDGDFDQTESGFLICLPIYKKGEIPASVEERKNNITGYIYSPFRSVDFLNEVQPGSGAADILLKIYDGEPSAENLLAQTIDLQNRTFQNQIDENYSAEREIRAAGRRWVVQFNSLPEFAAQSSLGWSPLIFIIGTICSFLLFGMTYWETSARLKLQSTAAELFETERQKQGLLEKEQAARFSAERANKTKDEFIAVVSHELRTPLNAIAGWTRILRTEDLSGNTKNLALEKIEKNLRLQTRMVEDLLGYSQILSGTVKPGSEEINLAEVFEQAFAEVEPAAREKNVEFTKENQLNGHLILGDAGKIKTVVRNLLNNAVKFTPSGGRVETSLKEAGETLQMTIKDSGKGISREFLPHIFDCFAQADASSTRTAGGFGLGLTISNQIVKLHRGKIEARSAGNDQGATFIVTLPNYKKSAQTAENSDS